MYQIVFWRNGAQIGSVDWKQNLVTAKDFALRYLPVHQATRAEILNVETMAVEATYCGDDADR